MKHYTAKILVLISILLVLIVAAGIFSQRLLKKDSENMTAAIDVTVKCTQSDNWNGAQASINEVQRIWSKVKGSWSALIDHQEIDNIDVTLRELDASVKSKELPESLLQSAALKTYIGHIPEREMLKLENLF